MDKEKLLDIDYKSYCKARIEAKCKEVNQLSWNIYLKCKDYEDYEYSNWDKKKNIIEKVVFNEKEQKIVNLINNKLDIDKYLVKENLEYFEIINLQKFGYYQSEKNIIYITVYYRLKCIDNTTSCDKLDYFKEDAIEANRPFSFMIKVDIKDYNYIENINSFAAHINSDWKQELGRVE